MITNSSKATKDFFDSLTTIEEPSFYLPGSVAVGHNRDKFSYSDTKKTSETRLSKLREILNWAGAYIPGPYTAMYENIGVNRTQGLSLVREAIDIGWITEGQYHPSRRGGCIKIPLPTEKGWQELECLGKERPEAVLGGGKDHDLGGKVLKVLGNWHGYSTCLYEILIGVEKNVRTDVVLQNTKGERIYCQCCFSDAPREAVAGCKILSVTPAETSKVLFVTKDKAFSYNLLKLLSKEAVYQQNKERVFMRVFGDLLEAYYKRSNQVLL
jgi:hypothetical protein